MVVTVPQNEQISKDRKIERKRVGSAISRKRANGGSINI